jgi:outer membrane biogenesis lipoprotein LolB
LYVQAACTLKKSSNNNNNNNNNNKVVTRLLLKIDKFWAENEVLYVSKEQHQYQHFHLY